jgi:membrane-bound lytic murein transglycosylase B
MQLGVRRARGEDFPRPVDVAVLIAPAGASGPAFLLLRNHFVIKRYNNSTAYSIAVGHLADRLRGGGDFVQPWPANERPLTADESVELQRHLARAGFYDGAIDGKIGPKSRAAIRAWQNVRGLVADGFAGLQLLETLRSG